MQYSDSAPIHARHAELVADTHEYLAAMQGKSAAWLGWVTCKDTRLVPGLIRGQSYPVEILRSLQMRLSAVLAAPMASGPVASGSRHGAEVAFLWGRSNVRRVTGVVHGERICGDVRWLNVLAGNGFETRTFIVPAQVVRPTAAGGERPATLPLAV